MALGKCYFHLTMTLGTEDNLRQRIAWHIYPKLHQLHGLIAKGDHPGTQKLSENLEVSVRTVKRYLDYLREQDAPLSYCHKHKGYYFADAFWQLPPMKLTEGDLLAFFIAEQSLKLTGQNAYARQLRISLSKLSGLLPKEVSINLTTLSTGVSFQSLPYAFAKPELLTLLATSSINQQIVEFDYFSPHNREHTKRKAGVLLLHNFAGDWFAVCRDLEKSAERDFHVGRMSNIKLLEESFESPHCWNAEDYLKTGFFMMRGGKPVTVEIHFDSYQAQWIREREFFHADEKREELPDGSLRLSFKIGEQGLAAVARFCLTYAGHCRAEKPEKLKEIIREKLLKGLSLHQ